MTCMMQQMSIATTSICRVLSSPELIKGSGVSMVASGNSQHGQAKLAVHNTSDVIVPADCRYVQSGFIHHYMYTSCVEYLATCKRIQSATSQANYLSKDNT